MAHEFTMPKLGLTMTDGTIREWLVPEGTMVRAGDPVLIIETDKVETEVEARQAGVLQPTAAIGETFECGAVIGWLLDAAEVPVGGTAPVPASTAEPAAETVVGSSASTAGATRAAAASAKNGGGAPAPTGADVASRGEGRRILASPRARAAAREQGIDLATVAGSGPDGRVLFDDLETFRAAAEAVENSVQSMPGADVAARGEGGRILASPRARAVARHQGVDLAHVAGSGPSGRILFDDVLAFQAAAPAPVEPPSMDELQSGAVPIASTKRTVVPRERSGGVTLATGGARILADLLGVDLTAVPAGPGERLTRDDVAAWVRARLASSDEAAAIAVVDEAPAEAPLLQEPTSVIPLRGMRGVIAERMHTSLAEMAQLSLSVDVDMTAINAERERRREQGATVPGYTAWVVAAASRALADHPAVNSQVTGDGVALLPDIHVGVAVALEDGLIVPVVDHAIDRDVENIHAAVADLATRARGGKLQLEELEGGTFSVTALGMYGVDMFTPVINPPNTAILGVGRLRTDTVWNDGQPQPTTVMTLSLTWDHRAFDGAPAAEFAQTIVRYLEDPAQLG